MFANRRILTIGPSVRTGAVVTIPTPVGAVGDLLEICWKSRERWGLNGSQVTQYMGPVGTEGHKI
jgi:cellulose synthase/poly-beta-1,6-N-acetylglucosamine synthase-like glycosyltransferase